MRRIVSSFLALGIALGLSGPAHADDLADEADLKFRLGAEAYQRADYKVALEKFLESNRLVPNRNVTYNVGFTGDRAHAKEVRELGDAVMKTLRVPPFKNEDFGQSRDFARGRLMGSVIGKLVGVGFVLAVVILLVRQRNKKAARTPR